MSAPKDKTINRRDLVQAVSKAALPIITLIGFGRSVTLAAKPSHENQKSAKGLPQQRNDCTNSCEGTCKTTCEDTCTAACKGDCQSTCKDACLDTCKDTCTLGCGKTCRAVCADTCTVTSK